MSNIEYYFEPENIAVIGASKTEGKGGYLLLKNLIDSYDGDIYPVNPNEDEIMGLDCYSSITEVPVDVDLASILVPSPFVADVMEECAEKNVKALFLGSGGFADAGEEGEKLQEKIVGIAEEHDMRLWGPNCGGYISSNPDMSNCYLLDSEGHMEEYLGGNVSFVSQSGMMAGGVYVEMITEDIVDLGKTLTIGNRADVAESDLLSYLKDDEHTDVVGIYQESVVKGREYKRALAETSKDKPVVVLKGGRSEGGVKAAMSHTGSIAGDDRMADAVLRQFGATRVADFRELLDFTKGFSMYPEGMEGKNIAILTMTGAGSVIAADLFGDYGLEMAELSDETLDRLEEIYPDWIAPMNPVDIWTTLEQIGIDETLTVCLETLMADENVDGILFEPLAFSYFEDFDFDAFTDIAESGDTPIVTWLVGEKDHTPYWVEHLEDADIPVYRDMTTCVKFMGAMREYADWRSSREDVPVAAEVDAPAAADDAVKAVRDDGRSAMTEAEAKAFLAEFGVPVTRETVATDADAAVAAAEDIGYPVVLKVSSSDIQHKSEAGGIALDLRDAEEVREAFETVTENARAYDSDADVEGVLVGEMLSEGREVIVGVKNDPEFGPMVLFGLGGIFVEVLEDVALRAAPLTEADARAMIREIDGYPVLEGARGQGPADEDALVDLLLAVSDLAVSMDDDVAELDLNPVMVYEDGAVAADALVQLSE